MEKISDLRVGNGRVALDELGEHAAQGLDAQRERRHVQQQHVFDFALEHAGLDGRADRHDFVRVHALVRGLVDQRMRRFDHLRHAGHAADQHQFVDLVGRHARVAQAVLHRRDGALEQVVAQLLHLGAGQLHADVLGPAGVGRDERQVDFINLRAGERDLGLLGLFLDALQGIGLLAQVHAVLLLELVQNPIHDPAVPIVAAQVGVAVGRLDFENAVADFQHGNIERAAAQVVDGDLLVLLLVQPVSQGGGGRLVDDAQHFQAGNAPGIFGGLALGVVEIGRHGNDRLGDLLAQPHLRIGLQLAQNHRRDFRRAELLGFAVHFDFHVSIAVRTGNDLVRHPLPLLFHFGELAAHEPLDGINGVPGIGDRLSLGRIPDQPLARSS